MLNRNQIAFIFNSQLKETEIEARNLVDSLGINDRAWICSAANLIEKSDDLDETSLLIVVGGDGTILRTIRAVSAYNIPVLGVNMGKVGFMAELRPDEAIERIPEFIQFTETGEGSIRV